MSDLVTRLYNEPVSVSLCNDAAEHIEKIEGLLEVAACPNCGINKDGAYYDNMGEVHQCQWCAEVNAALQEASDE